MSGRNIRDIALETHPSVICDFNVPPENPKLGQRFGILDRPLGVWAEHPNGIAEWDGTGWRFTDPVAGMVVFNEEEDRAYRFTGTEWVPA